MNKRFYLIEEVSFKKCVVFSFDKTHLIALKCIAHDATSMLFYRSFKMHLVVRRLRGPHRLEPQVKRLTGR